MHMHTHTQTQTNKIYVGEAHLGMLRLREIEVAFKKKN